MSSRAEVHRTAPRQRGGDRKRARVRHQRAPAAGPGNAAEGRQVPRCRRARPQRLSQCSRHTSPAPDPAVGVHVQLGSQSLGGAFTLARSTLGQMAVRIALQCSEVDSLLILAENNLAAKWLSRPGEAIYNDANGAPEGNHFFQVVWLPDERREDYLKQIRAMGNERGGALPRSPIVFEGDATALHTFDISLKYL
ncbi:MAG: hypothetical protein ACXWNS_13445 [Isosphaeraceae bacterium]